MINPAAADLLNLLLDRFEQPVQRQRDIQCRPASSLSVSAIHDLREVATLGGISIEWNRGELSHTIRRVRLKDARRLYKVLGRQPVDQIINAATDVFNRRIQGRSLERTAPVIEDILSAWQEKRSAHGFSYSNADRAASFVVALDAVLEGNFNGLDIRTVSVKRTGDSKLIASYKPQITRYLKSIGRAPKEVPDDSVLEWIGLESLPRPILVAGPVEVQGVTASLVDLVYFGIAGDDATRITPTEPN